MLKSTSRFFTLFILLATFLGSCKKEDTSDTNSVNNSDDSSDNNSSLMISNQSFDTPESATYQDVIAEIEAEGDVYDYYLSENPQNLFIIDFEGSLRLDTGNTFDVGKARSHTIKVGVTNGTDSAEADITINLYFESDAFITSWTTTSEWETIEIPVNPDFSNYNYSVDWGNGAVQNNITGSVEYTYSQPGTYIVRITGTFPAIQLTSSPSTNRAKLSSIENWGANQWQTMHAAFSGATNMHCYAEDTPDLSDVTNFKNMFDDCESLNEPLNNWDMSQAEDISYMFMNAISFNQNINNWNTNNVKKMVRVFSGAKAFNQPLNNWDVSNVTSMDGMFRFTDHFNQSINSWDVSNVSDFAGMFLDAKAFNQPLNNWNTGNAENLQSMFEKAVAFNQNINDWNVSNVTNMRSFLQDASNYNQPLNGWNVSKVNDTREMFSGASKFNQPLNNWNVTQVTNMLRMFKDALVFTQDISSWNTINVSVCDGFSENSALANNQLPTAGSCF